jgi:hypothetical protein
MTLREFDDCRNHDYRACPWRDDVVAWFTRHPLASHCSCEPCRAATGRLATEQDADLPPDLGWGDQ